MIIRRLLRRLTRRFGLRRLITYYILSLTPLNYLTTGLTTGSNIFNPLQVINVIKHTEALTSVSGIINTLTGGAVEPIIHSVAVGFGYVSNAVGSVFKIESFKQYGENLMQYGSDWFSIGHKFKNASDSHSQIKVLINRQSFINSKEDRSI